VGSDRVSSKTFSSYLASTDTLIEGGKSIIIDCIVVNNQDGFFGHFFTIRNIRGEQIFDFYIPPGNTIVIPNSFVSDFGTVIKAGNIWISYTIFYKGSG
jgi:hypothetical protein